MDLIHELNTIHWRPGDLIIHDSDAKRADMLMIVLGQDVTSVFRTRYAFPWAHSPERGAARSGATRLSGCTIQRGLGSHATLAPALRRPT